MPLGAGERPEANVPNLPGAEGLAANKFFMPHLTADLPNQLSTQHPLHRWRDNSKSHMAVQF